MNSPDRPLVTSGERGEILLVDDSPSALSLLSTLLTEAGYTVREAPSGEMALMTLKVRLPDLVLLDVRMPEMDGFEVCRRMKVDPVIRDVTVIFLSAQDETADRVQGLQVGAVDFIAKAFPQEEVFARLDTHIALSRAKKALEQERAHLEDRVRERTEALRREQALLQSVIDSAPDWICVTDRDHRYLLVNRNMATALGDSDSSKLIGKSNCKDFPRDDCPQMVADDRCDWHDDESVMLSGKAVFQPQERIVLPDGRHLIVETHKTSLHDADGELYGVLCYRRDISQRLQMEEDARVLEQSLWQARKMEAIGLLSGGIAHDFNHLLSVILGYAQFAQTAFASGKTEKLGDYVAEILKAGTEGQTVVKQLLAFSRTDERAADAADIGPVLNELIKSLRQIFEAHIVLELILVADLPPVYIKPIQVKQVMTNLVLNARDALGEAGGRIRIALQTDHISEPKICNSCRKMFHGHYLALSVADNGSGVPAAIIDNIFDPFFSTKDVGNGSGLGLSMVHGIVHSAGGHIVVESAAGQGTVFSIYIPYPQGVTTV